MKFCGYSSLVTAMKQIIGRKLGQIIMNCYKKNLVKKKNYRVGGEGGGGGKGKPRAPIGGRKP